MYFYVLALAIKMTRERERKKNRTTGYSFPQERKESISITE